MTKKNGLLKHRVLAMFICVAILVAFLPTYNANAATLTLEEYILNSNAIASGAYGTVAVKNGAAYGWGNIDIAHDSFDIPVLNPYEYTPRLISYKYFNEKITSVKAGNNHYLFLTESGKVYGMGSNLYHQVSVDNTYVFNMPTLINIGADEGIAIECGYDYSAILTSNGEVYVFGDNQYGQLGLGHKNQVVSPTKIPSISNVKYISSGFNHLALATADGKAYVAGLNNTNQIAGLVGASSTVMKEVTIPDAKTVKYISAGGNHTHVIANDNTVYGWGSNYDGELGVNLTSNRVSTPTLIPSVTATYIFDGYGVSMLFGTDNKVYIAGSNKYYQHLTTADSDKHTVYSELNTAALSGDLLGINGKVNNLIANTSTGLSSWGSNAFKQSGDYNEVNTPVISTPTNISLPLSDLPPDTACKIEFKVEDSQGNIYNANDSNINVNAGEVIKLHGDFTDFYQLGSFMLPIKFNQTLLKVVDSTLKEVQTGAINAVDGSCGITSYQGTADWNGELLLNGRYPNVENNKGMVSVFGKNTNSDTSIVGTKRLFTVTFKAIGTGNANFKYAEPSDLVYEYYFPSKGYFSPTFISDTRMKPQLDVKETLFPVMKTTVNSLTSIAFLEGGVEKNSITLEGYDNSTKNVTISYQPADASYKEVVWSSPALISGTGKVSEFVEISNQTDLGFDFKLKTNLRKEGTVNITATPKFQPELAKTFSIIVKNQKPNDIEITNKNAIKSVYDTKDEEFQISARCLPDYVTGKDIIWSSSDESCLKITPSQDTGSVTAKVLKSKADPIVVTAKSKEDNSLVDSVNINIKIAPTAVDTKTNVWLGNSETKEITYSLTPSESMASTVSLNLKNPADSDKLDINGMNVTSKGVAALTPVELILTVNEIATPINVYISDVAVAPSIAINNKNLLSEVQTQLNKEIVLNAAIAPNDLSDKNIKWQSENPGSVSITPNTDGTSATVKILKTTQGKVKIRAYSDTYTGVEDEVLVDVKLALTELSLNKDVYYIGKNETTTIGFALTPPDAAVTPEITFVDSSQSDLLSIDSQTYKISSKGVETGSTPVLLELKAGTFTKQIKVYIAGETAPELTINKAGIQNVYTLLNETFVLPASLTPTGNIVWTSSDPSKASVVYEGDGSTATVKILGTAPSVVLTATSADFSDLKDSVSIKIELALTDISITNGNSYNLSRTGEVTVDYTLVPADAVCDPVSIELVNESQSGLVKIEGNKITALGTGGVVPMRFVSGLVKKDFTVIIFDSSEVPSITVANEDEIKNLYTTNETLTLKATIAPADLSNKNLIWESENGAKVSVVPNADGTEALLTILKSTAQNEKVKITVKSELYETIFKTYEIDVKLALTDMEITSANPVVMGKSVTEKITFNPIPQTAVYEKPVLSLANAMDSQYIDINNETLEITSKGVATTTPVELKLTSGAIVKSINVNVSSSSQTPKVTIDKTSIKNTYNIKNEKFQLSTSITTGLTDETILYESSNPDVATVSQTGEVEIIAHSSDKVKITAKSQLYPSIKDSIEFTVDFKLNSIAVSNLQPIIISKTGSATVSYTLEPTYAVCDTPIIEYINVADSDYIEINNQTMEIKGKGLVPPLGRKIPLRIVSGTVVTSFEVSIINASSEPTISIENKDAVQNPLTTLDDVVLTAVMGPLDLENKKINWESTDESIIKIEKNEDGTVATLKILDNTKTGTPVTIKASSLAYNTIFDTVDVTVNVPVSKIEVSKKPIILAKGEVFNVIATKVPATAPGDITLSVPEEHKDKLTINGMEITAGNTEMKTTPILLTVACQSLTEVIEVYILDNPKPQMAITNKNIVAPLYSKSGYKQTLNATLTADSFVNTKILWKSSDQSKVKIEPSSDGLSAVITVLRTTDTPVTITAYSEEMPAVYDEVSYNVKLDVIDILLDDVIYLKTNETKTVNYTIVPADAVNANAKIQLVNPSDSDKLTINGNEITAGASATLSPIKLKVKTMECEKEFSVIISINDITSPITVPEISVANLKGNAQDKIIVDATKNSLEEQLKNGDVIKIYETSDSVSPILSHNVISDVASLEIPIQTLNKNGGDIYVSITRNAIESSKLYVKYEKEPLILGKVTKSGRKLDTNGGISVKLYSDESTLYKETTTDNNGHFEFENCANGTYILIITSKNYVSKKIINVKVDDTSSIEFITEIYPGAFTKDDQVTTYDYYYCAQQLFGAKIPENGDTDFNNVSNYSYEDAEGNKYTYFDLYDLKKVEDSLKIFIDKDVIYNSSWDL